MGRRLAIATLVGAVVAALAGTAWTLSSAGTTTRGGPLRVVAAESFWGSIAAQLGGARVRVTSIVTNPDTDPHDYEPTAVDARTLAEAGFVIANGIGYDPWVSKLLAANPLSGRIALTVGDLLGLKTGANPHRWYSPRDVHRVVAAITRDYERLDPQHRRYFESRKAWFESVGLRTYRHEIATIRRRYSGVAVGASESIFTPLAQALGLRLLTPSSFLDAISEGAEPTVKDLTTIGRQISHREIRAWVVNSQNSTPDVQRLTSAARRRGIPVTTVTETLAPESATFQAWQVAQLSRLATALAAGTRQ